MSKSVLLSYIIIADVARIKREVKIGKKKHIKVQFWAELIHRRLNSAAPPEVINRSLLPSHHASKEAGPHGLGINSTTVGTALHETRGLHGLKTEARTRARTRDRLTRPDPTRAAQLNLEPEPNPKSPPPPITNKKKIAFHDCMQRNGLIKALPFQKHLPVMKVCEHQVQRSRTFCRVYEFCLDKKMMTVQIMVIFCQLRLVSILSTLNQT